MGQLGSKKLTMTLSPQEPIPPRGKVTDSVQPFTTVLNRLVQERLQLIEIRSVLAVCEHELSLDLVEVFM